jgi:hypothetical protein
MGGGAERGGKREPDPAGDLERLIELEGRLAALLAAARAEAAAIVAEARTDAGRQAETIAAAEAAAEQDLAARLAAERDGALATLAAETTRRLERFDLPAARVAELARLVVGAVGAG